VKSERFVELAHDFMGHRADAGADPFDGHRPDLFRRGNTARSWGRVQNPAPFGEFALGHVRTTLYSTSLRTSALSYPLRPPHRYRHSPQIPPETAPIPHGRRRTTGSQFDGESPTFIDR
jgi:hypothetical protein